MHNGKNVTADPPRTEIWALLYAQVKQADNTEYRNILLDDRVLSVNLRILHQLDRRAVLTIEQSDNLRRAAFQNFQGGTAYGKFQDVLTLADTSTVNPDATKYGSALWVTAEVTALLALYGLPSDSPLSVLCVETLPHINNVYEHVSALHKRDVRDRLRSMVGSENLPSEPAFAEALATRGDAGNSVFLSQPRPLSRQLGQYRILRTSPLTKVPFVC